MTWKFVPPRSPYWGGLWESAIKRAKFRLVRFMNNTQLNYEEFNTVLCQIESLMNSRLSNDPCNFQVLTPGHFLVGNTEHAKKDISHIPENRLLIYQKLSRMYNVFWKRWSVEYKNHLQNRSKWCLLKRNFVLLKEGNTPPMIWPLTRIIEGMSSTDGKVRVVRLQIANDTYVRSITTICLLPIQEHLSSLTSSLRFISRSRM